MDLQRINQYKSSFDNIQQYIKSDSQTWLAKKLGKSFNFVNSYVCNRTQPNQKTLFLISEILNVQMKDLICETSQIEKEK